MLRLCLSSNRRVLQVTQPERQQTIHGDAHFEIPDQPHSLGRHGIASLARPFPFTLPADIASPAPNEVIIPLVAELIETCRHLCVPTPSTTDRAKENSRPSEEPANRRRELLLVPSLQRVNDPSENGSAHRSRYQSRPAGQILGLLTT